MAWEKVKLGDVCKIGDGAHASLKRLSQGIPYLTAKNLTRNGIDVQNLDFIDEITYNKHFKESSTALTRPQKDDILYSIIGSIGGMYLVKDEKIGISSSVAIFRSNPSILISKYLYYYLKSSLFDSQIQAIKGGVAQGFMSLSKLSSIEISYPLEIKTQKRIADILSVYDNLIENNQKQIKLLEEAAQRLYKQWFIDLRYPGHETTKIVNGLPEGWRKEKLGNVIEYIRGTSYTSSELSDSDGVLMVNLKNINAFGGYKRNAEKRFTGKYKENGILESGDLVMGCTDMTKERRLVGHVALIPNLKERAVFTMDLLKILPKTISKTFLYAQCRFGGLSYKIAPLANGANVLHLRPENMADIEVLCPAKSIVEMYDNVFASMISKIEKLEDQIQLASESRNRLLPKLMNNELEV